MTGAFSWENCQPLPCIIWYSKAKLTCYSRYYLTSYFSIPVPYDEKDILFLCQCQKVLLVFIEQFNFSFFGISGLGIDFDYCDIGQIVLNSMYTMEYYSAQLYPILCNPMDCSPPGSLVHRTLQARILEQVAIPDPGIEPVSSTLQADSLPLIHQGRPIKRMK